MDKKNEEFFFSTRIILDPRIILMNRVSSFRRKVRGIRSFSSIFLFSLSADYIYFQEIFQFSVRCVQDTLFFVFFFFLIVSH